jgi:hypothetical protein
MAERVLVNIDTDVHPDLINSRFAYVSVSRASHYAQIYTNDVTKLATSISKDVSKASGLNIGVTPDLSSSIGQSNRPKLSNGISIGLSL